MQYGRKSITSFLHKQDGIIGDSRWIWSKKEILVRPTTYYVDNRSTDTLPLPGQKGEMLHPLSAQHAFLVLWFYGITLYGCFFSNRTHEIHILNWCQVEAGKEKRPHSGAGHSPKMQIQYDQTRLIRSVFCKWPWTWDTDRRKTRVTRKKEFIRLVFSQNSSRRKRSYGMLSLSGWVGKGTDCLSVSNPWPSFLLICSILLAFTLV